MEMSTPLNSSDGYRQLLQQISDTYTQGRVRAVQVLRDRWSVRELVRQKDSALFLRLAASQDKAGILQLAQQGRVVEQPADLLREPYIRISSSS